MREVFFGFKVVSRLFSTWTTPKRLNDKSAKSRTAQTRRAFRDHKKRKKTDAQTFSGREREREREKITQRALPAQKTKRHQLTHARAHTFGVAAPPLEKDGRRFASATTCARNTRRLKSSSSSKRNRARSLLGAKVSKRRREEAI